MLCTKTLYNYVNLGPIDIKNIDIPQKLIRKTKIQKTKEHKRILERRIVERPESVETREECGQWQTDLVIGQKSGNDDVLLSLLARKSRQLFILRLPDKSAESVIDVFEKIKSDHGDYFSKVFRTIPTDNGSEFTRLAELENGTEIQIFFTHPYTSCEKRSIENHNGLIRRSIPKGKRTEDYTDEDILTIELWTNGLPRKILGYKTPEEIFDKEMDLIYAS